VRKCDFNAGVVAKKGIAGISEVLVQWPNHYITQVVIEFLVTVIYFFSKGPLNGCVCVLVIFKNFFRESLLPLLTLFLYAEFSSHFAIYCGYLWCLLYHVFVLERYFC